MDETNSGAPPKEGVSHTRMVTMRACRYQHHLTYDLGVRPIRQSIQLTFGSVFHAWLQAWFTALLTFKVASWIPTSAPLWRSDEEEEYGVPTSDWLGFEKLEAADPFEAAKLRAMVLAYHMRWKLQPWRVIAVEVPFKAPLINPVDGTVSKTYERDGRIDLIVDIPSSAGPEDEGLWVVEHKSNSGPLKPGATYFEKLRMDPQCSDYLIGARALGLEPRGIIYDVACKPMIEPKKATPEADREMTIGTGCKKCGGGKNDDGVMQPGDGKSGRVGDDGERLPCSACGGSGWKEAPRYKAHVRLADETPGEYGQRCFEIMITEPERYFHRVKVVRLADEMRDHEISTWYTVRSMHEERRHGVFPRNPDACFRFSRVCDYRPICIRSATKDDTSLYRIGRRYDLRVVEEI